ncbi:ABC transporter substrate-binding protein [Deinococcus peraridilitoris]|uniref:ABC-type dipeptide transport system, periplasmic component n=1 Tax=Deinococcus peraridilitoris (strain DSM 19664 / LMG 22246 / CIP 109416 / KR-200) TaxID=937777 RepID=L0A4R9_DEIPD|nr:ABC transporter substrate-binding protein [Deinococcus peraridilitoris]AFZ68015.1 ABC-type dipeptide transport system, periplasmic component [Deinococcus peraridilitoris DSM 19664]
MRRFALALTVMLIGTAQAQGAATLVYGAGGEPVTLESGNVNDTNSVIVQNQIYDTLTRMKPGTVELAPGLASSWKANKALTEWTFVLRQGVKFHDGTAFNADAVIFNVNRWWDPGDTYGYRAQGKAWESWKLILGEAKGSGSLLSAVRKDSDSQVTFVLSRPVADFPAMISTNFFGFASPTAVKKAGEKYGTPGVGAVGTGPYIFESWTSGSQLTLKANPSYWGSKPKTSTLVFRFIKDPSARLNELKAGTVDFTCDLTPDALGAIRNDSNLSVVLRPSFNVGFLSLNSKHPILKNQKVRQAMALALNRKEMVSAFWGELGESDNSFIPPALGWANSKVVPAQPRFDPQAAKKLLAEAGYPNGFTLDLWYMPVSRPYFPTPKPTAEAIAADLSAIGIKANLKTEDWAAYLADRNKDPGFDMYMIGWSGQFGSPNNFYGPFYGEGGTADSKFDSAEIQQLLLKATGSASRAEQTRAYAKVHELTHEAAVRIPIVHSRPLCATRTYLKGWVPGPSNSEAFNTITVTGKK